MPEKKTDALFFDAVSELIRQRVLTAPQPVNPEWSRELFDDIIEACFAQLIEAGQVRFPRGLGSLHLTTLSPTRRRNLQGEWVERTDPLPVVRYREGLVVKSALGRRTAPPAKKSLKSLHELGLSRACKE